MFLLGMLSVFQIIILPGLIFQKLLKIKTENIIQSFLYSIGLSLYLNYLIVCILTWIKIYIAPVVYLLFIIELFVLFYIYIREHYVTLSNKTIKDYYQDVTRYIAKLSSLQKTAFILSIVVILFFICLIPFSTGTAYYFSDALMHWTRWPACWATNNFPIDTNHYPQLFPTNLSLIYVFTGEPSIRFFPKLIMPLFFIGIIMMFFDLAIVRNSLVHLTGLIIYSGFLIVFYSLLFILEVNADIPVSFFSFLTFYTVIRSNNESFEIKTILLITIFAVSTANTKLAGVFTLLIASFWVLKIFYDNRRTVSKHDMIRACIYIMLILFGSIFWYIIRPIEMIKGLDQSVYMQPGYNTRFIIAVNMLVYSLSLPFLIFIALTLIAALFSKESKYIVLLIIIPAVIIWAYSFSADFRNLSFAIPFIAYASAYGLRFIFDKIVKKKDDSFFLKSIFKRKTFIYIIFVLCNAAVFIIAGTDYFFNFGMKLAYFMSKYLFGSQRIIYTTEIGYYRYVEYYSSALKLLSFLFLILFAVRKSKIKIVHIYIFVAVAAIAANFTLLSKENIRQRQIYDNEMVDVHNLYFVVYPILKTSSPSNIETNSILFCSLIFPAGIKLEYINGITPELITKYNFQHGNKYLLLQKEKISRETLNYVKQRVAAKNYLICYEDYEFIYLKIES
jgi:hypothetical protein